MLKLWDIVLVFVSNEITVEHPLISAQPTTTNTVEYITSPAKQHIPQRRTAAWPGGVEREEGSMAFATMNASPPAACKMLPPEGDIPAACEMLPPEGDIPAACKMLPPEGDISAACKILPLERESTVCGNAPSRKGIRHMRNAPPWEGIHFPQISC